MTKIGLTDALRELRNELIASMAEARDQDIKFRLGTVDIELQVVAQKAVEGGVSVKFWVVDANTKASGSATKTHTIKVQLHPVTKDGHEVWTGDHLEELPS